MKLFGANITNTIADEVETATNENNTDDKWDYIINICDKAGKNPEDAKTYLRAIIRRLYNGDPHIALQAVTLLDACIKNSGRNFHVEVASREFENDFMKLATKAHPTVSAKLHESLKRWADNEFKSDPQLSLITSLYNKLKNSGYDFAAVTAPETTVKKLVTVNKDPNVVETQEEEDEILKAIELSLKETTIGSPKSVSLYPSANLAAATMMSTTPTATTMSAKEPKKVRALYDFEAAEDNELTFTSGEIIVVIDDSDPNWWKGSNHRGEGLFPANFVTKDLTLEVDEYSEPAADKSSKHAQHVDVDKVDEVKKDEEDIEINEEKIDRLLHLLHEADPTNPARDTEEMLKLEREVNGMGPLIDSELERVDRKHAQLTQLSTDLVEALGLYHTLMREPQFPPINKLSYGFPVSQPPPSSAGFNGNMPPHHAMMGPPPMSGPPGLQHPDNNRPMFVQPGAGGGTPPPQYYTMPYPVNGTIHFDHNHSAVGPLPPGISPQTGGLPLPPGSVSLPPPSGPDDRRLDPNMGHYASLPRFVPPNFIPPNFQPMGSQTGLNNASVVAQQSDLQYMNQHQQQAPSK